MITTWKNIAVFLDATPESEKLGDYAAELARRHGAHLIGIYGIRRTDVEHPEATFARGSQAIRAVAELHAAADESKVLAAGRHFGQVSRAYDISAEFRVIWSDKADHEAALHSLHCDLAIVGHPGLSGFPEGWTPERLSRASAVPILVIPQSWPANTVGDHIVVAWNATREAKRAVSDALPFIVTAKSVTVLVVDADKGIHPYGEDPGADIALYLARHGANVTVASVSSDDKPIAETILDYATGKNADLIVFGASRHTRLAELFLGGVSRALSTQVTLPLFLSR